MDSRLGTGVLLLIFLGCFSIWSMRMQSPQQEGNTIALGTTSTTARSQPRQPETKKQKQQQPVHTFPGITGGLLDAHPPRSDSEEQQNYEQQKQQQQCVSLRIRGRGTKLYSLQQTIQWLHQHCEDLEDLHETRFHVGLEFVSTKNTFQAIHFLDFVWTAYQALHQLKTACPDTVFQLSKKQTKQQQQQQQQQQTTGVSSSSTLAQGVLRIHVPWVYVPTMQRKQLPTAATTWMDWVWQAASSSSSTQNQNQHRRRPPALVQLYDLYTNDPTTRNQHTAFRGVSPPQHKDEVPFTPHDEMKAVSLYRTMIQQADAVLFVQPEFCFPERTDEIPKRVVRNNDDDDDEAVVTTNSNSTHNRHDQQLMMWQHNKEQTFPIQQWHQDTWTGLGKIRKSKKGSKLVVCLLVPARDHTPNPYAKWFHSFLESRKAEMDLLVLKSENYDMMEKIKLATSCHVWITEAQQQSRKNQRSRISNNSDNDMILPIWMQPNSFVLEFFWAIDHISLAVKTMADTMGHSYLGLLEGQVMNAENDYFLGEADPASVKNRTDYEAYLNKGFDAIEQFFERAMQANVKT